MVFIDTNIFVYVVSSAEEDRQKKQIAQSLLTRHAFGLSVQILQEFMHVTLRKRHLGLTREEIIQMVAFLSSYPLVETTVSLAQTAFDLQGLYQTSYWDAAILAAAKELGCHTLYSEDLNHGQNYEGVTVINPFLP